VNIDVLVKFFNVSCFSFSADAFDTEQLLHCVDILKSGQPYQIPIYDFKTHQRKVDAFRQVHGSSFV
jgi:uridine kinase